MLIERTNRSDGGTRGWLGDMAKACDHDWYYSNIIVGEEGHKPACAWLDKNHSYGLWTSAIQIHMEDFVALSNDYSNDTADYCRLPAMLFKHEHTYEFKGGAAIWNLAHPDDHFRYDLWTGPEGPDWLKKEDDWNEIMKNPSRHPGQGFKWSPHHSVNPPKRREPREASSRAFTHLIASPHALHSAQEICESETSHGPDFVSLSEGIFCDMDTKVHRPLCTAEGLDDGCYHWDSHSLIIDGERLARNYSHVVEWD